jgi:hypothetical protein
MAVARWGEGVVEVARKEIAAARENAQKWLRSLIILLRPTYFTFNMRRHISMSTAPCIRKTVEWGNHLRLEKFRRRTVERQKIGRTTD